MSKSNDRKRLVLLIDQLHATGKDFVVQQYFFFSYRQLHVLDETWVMNACREDCCYVSMDFQGDMKIAAKRNSSQNTIVRDYVLPDFTTIRYATDMDFVFA